MGQARALSGFPYRTLRRPLDPAARRRIAAHLRGLLDWQHLLRKWPSLAAAPDATPFVSIYARERLVGCFGSDEGEPAERVSRAFLRALGDTRHHPLAVSDRPGVLAHIAYPIAPFRIDPERDVARLEAGTHGLLRVDPGGSGVLLPSVARDGRFDADALLDRLADKSGVRREQLGDGTVFAFATETVSAASPSSMDPRALALGWLAALVDDRGQVCFEIDARRRTREARGKMFHGRAAIVVAALQGSRAHRTTAARARARLAEEARRALRGRPVASWPDAPDAVAGTLALLRLAGAIDDGPLLAFLDGQRSVATSAWHAAQCASALGARTPAWLWSACVADLARTPWAPWTLLGARARGDAAIVARVAPVVARSLAETGPHRGGATVTAVPELALTALCVESLAGLPGRQAHAAVERGRGFLLRWQLRPETLLGAHDPTLALGAFPGSPIADALRADITAHAVLALS